MWRTRAPSEKLFIQRASNMAKKKKRWLKIGVPIAVVLIIVIFVAANLSKKKDKATEVQVEKTNRGRLVETVSGTGRVQPEVQVKISANVSARILELHVKEGDLVKKGDLLVRLDRERYEAVAEQASSGLKSAQAALEKSQNELRRIEEMYPRGGASQAELEAAQAQYKLNSANLEQAQAMLKQARDDLAKTSIYSPMDGIVSLLNKEVGEIALGAQFQEDVILVVADLSKMEVVVEVDENDIVNVSLQDTAKVEIDAYPDTTFKGQVREIAHTATTRGMGTAEELTNFEVKIALLELPHNLRPGMSATADVVTEVHESSLKIPIQCVVMREPAPPGGFKKEDGKKSKKKKKAEPGEAQADTLTKPDSAQAPGDPKPKPQPVEVVFRIQNGVAHQVQVKTGISSEMDIEIIEGLAETDTVVSGPFRTLSQKLKDGDQVKIKQAPSGDAGSEGRVEDQEMMDEF